MLVRLGQVFNEANLERLEVPFQNIQGLLNIAIVFHEKVGIEAVSVGVCVECVCDVFWCISSPQTPYIGANLLWRILFAE
jgi:hypothetical protein